MGQLSQAEQAPHPQLSVVRGLNTAVEFNFADKACTPLELDEAIRRCGPGHACWLDLDAADRPAAEAALRQLRVGEVAIERAFGPFEGGRHDTSESCLHVVIAAVSLEGAELARSRLDLFFGEHFVVTLHHGRVAALERVHRTYAQDFAKFAQTMGFLVFEIFDYLIDEYRHAIRSLERSAETFQASIFGDVDDAIFSQVGRATRDLLGFRATLTTTRDILHQLATRRSSFVPESTQPFLEDLVGALERLGSDLDGAREVMAESLNLYMSIVSHRTNRVVSRLTAVSVIFLPLTFLCGVYGMNFRHQPELQWEYGYALFWVLAASIAAGLALMMKRWRWM